MLSRQKPHGFDVRSMYRARSRCTRYSSTTPTIDSCRIHCQNLLNKYDYPSYLQIPFMPPSTRDAHLAIRSLNVEVALVPDIVTNEHARIMRMQFWKDAIEDCFRGKPKAEPLSLILAHVLSSGVRLTKTFFQTVISERVNKPISCPLTSLLVRDSILATIFEHRLFGSTSVQNNYTCLLSSP